MATSSVNALAFVGAAYAPTGIGQIGSSFVEPLRRIGINSLNDLLQFSPLIVARRLIASANSGDTSIDLTKLVKAPFDSRDIKDAASWPLTALIALRRQQADALNTIGVKSVSALAELGREAEKEILRTLKDNGFFEPPSAPSELLPSILGAIATRVRFTTFVKDTQLSDLAIGVDARCAPELPVSGKVTDAGKRNSFDMFLGGLKDEIKRSGLPKVLSEIAAANSEAKLVNYVSRLAKQNEVYVGRLSDVFAHLTCPVIELGYVCGHLQEWTNLGTNLGEVVHSVSFAPGESRNIAKVNWYRRQAIARNEATKVSEAEQADFVQNRALEEITSAVAREHQSGGSATETGTTATAASFVGALAVGAGVGAAIGTVIEPGAGTAIGATIGAGVSGVAAGGLIMSQSQALGKIESDTSGDRSIIGEVQQRIQLSTSQTASAIRSLWSTIVIEDTQAENIEATTTNITNYNHMHALNLQYYEVLQHYLVRMGVEKIEPILLLPFTYLDFTGFQFIRDYWDVIREHIDDAGLKAQGDSYFVTEDVPAAPDLLPVPPEPQRPNGTIRNLRVSLAFSYDKAVTIRLFAKPPGGTQIEGEEDNIRTAGDVRRRNYSFERIEAVSRLDLVVEIDRNDGGLFVISVEVEEATLETDDEHLEVQNTPLGRVTIRDADRSGRYTKQWAVPGAENPKKYALAVAKRNAIIAENAARQAAFDALTADINRFKDRLERLVLRRRYYFTRIILNSLEPEELVRLIGAVELSQGGAGRLPLSAIADPNIIGFVTGAFILKLRRLDAHAQSKVLKRFGFGANVPTDIEALVAYADRTISFYDDREQKDPIVSVDHVYVPTGGLFAEAVLGRANSAEYLDPERFFHWDKSGIPNAAPAISPVGTETRFQGQTLNVTVPEGNLTIVQPQALPEPNGLQQALSAVQNGNLFRDMSKTEQLTTIVGKLADLSQALGKSASKMTGEAANKALQSAADLGKAAVSTAQALQSETAKGAQLAQAAKLDRENAARNPPLGPTPTPSPAPSAPNTQPSQPANPKPTLREETFRKQVGLNDVGGSGRVTHSIFTFIFNSVAGAAVGDFALSLRKDGLVVDEQSALPGTAVKTSLHFETGIAQLPVELTGAPGPLIMSISGVPDSNGSDTILSRADAFLLPPDRTNYVFRIDMELETIQVQASSGEEVKKAITGKIDLTIAGEPDEVAPGTAPGSGSAPARKKPKANRKPKLPTSVLDLLSSLIDVQFVGSVGAEGSDTTTNQGQFTFNVTLPTGDLKIALDERLSN